jgi:hypothetical protein
VQSLVVDSLPSGVPIGTANVLVQVGPYEIGSYVTVICNATDTKLPTPSGRGLTIVSSPYHTYDDLVALLAKLQWDRFCEAVEQIYEHIPKAATKRSLQKGLNTVFARNGFGYEMRNGQLERIGALTHDEAVAEARSILRDSDLKGPAEQFRKAQSFYHARPTPDCANAVKEAIGAVEGLARILVGDPSILLSKVPTLLSRTKGTHPALADLIVKLYGYRGDADGAAHGATGVRPVPLEEAEFVLGISASCIVYLARLYGRSIA